ncbi:uncharacterized protein [Procambarus clarkii]|uniref:uncharacterized protein n=1 Tax=Procambarus clarkii TaxID=6728 RepID=UPI001E670A87|nr:uncharacterized protein LOC123773226 [Procambarus clarkii]
MKIFAGLLLLVVLGQATASLYDKDVIDVYKLANKTPTSVGKFTKLQQVLASLQNHNKYRVHIIVLAPGGEAEDPGWVGAGKTDSEVVKSRARRFINLPPNSILSLIFTLSISAPGLADIGYVQHIANATFRLPNNTINFGRNFQHGASDRTNIYGRLETFLNSFGYDGQACTLRTLCEIAESPFENSLYGEVVNLVLSASRSPIEHAEYNKYMAAEYYGKTYGQCDRLYPTCPTSFLDKVSNAFT